MGIAQGMSILIDLADRMQTRRDIGCLFVWHRSDAKRLREMAEALGLDKANHIGHDHDQQHLARAFHSRNDPDQRNDQEPGRDAPANLLECRRLGVMARDGEDALEAQLRHDVAVHQRQRGNGTAHEVGRKDNARPRRGCDVRLGPHFSLITICCAIGSVHIV